MRGHFDPTLFEMFRSDPLVSGVRERTPDPVELCSRPAAARCA